MCIICSSAAGVRQPDEATLHRMFTNNPHGAGYMTARDGKVLISKGFMTWSDFIRTVRREAFTAADPVVYHFRISTQAGVNPEMTHPFPLTSELPLTRELDLECAAGVAHNGIIRLTSDRSDRLYSDTAHYIAEFMTYLLRDRDDLHNAEILDAIARTTDGSKWAIMDGSGYIATVGQWIDDDGLLYSNGTFRSVSYIDRGGVRYQRGTVIRSLFDDAPYSDEDDELPE